MGWYQNSKDSKHKVFVSYYHAEDQYYRDEFDKRFNHLFISKSVEPGDIDSDSSDEYIKRLIQDEYLTDSSVVLVLVGPKTHCRKHVDWEISAGLNKKVGGYSGLVGLLLPGASYSDIPPRLTDNINSRYAEFHTWGSACSSNETIKSVIQTAFDNRISESDKIKNNRKQYLWNTCG
jgi:hypothetical protein